MAAEPGTESVADARQAVVDARRPSRRNSTTWAWLPRLRWTSRPKSGVTPCARSVSARAPHSCCWAGPRRALKQVEQRVFPKRRYRKLTPAEIDRAIDRLGDEDQERVRAHIERDFASYLEKSHPKEQPNARRSFWGTYDTLMAIVGTAAARELVKRFIDVPQDARKKRQTAKPRLLPPTQRPQPPRQKLQPRRKGRRPPTQRRRRHRREGRRHRSRSRLNRSHSPGWPRADQA